MPLPPDPPAHPLGGMVQHLLPGWIKLPVVLLQKSLLSQRDGLLRCSQHLCGFLEVLRGLLCLQLGLNTTRPIITNQSAIVTLHFKHHGAVVTTVTNRHNDSAEVLRSDNSTTSHEQTLSRQGLNQLQRKSVWQTLYLSKALNSHTKCVCVTSCLELINTVSSDLRRMNAEGVSGSREVWTSFTPFALSWITDVSWLNFVYIAAAPGLADWEAKCSL